MNINPVFCLFLLATIISCAAGKQKKENQPQYFEADHPLLRYGGRIDFRDAKAPRLFQPGTYVEAQFEGTTCQIIIEDQQLWGKNQNYLELVVDGESRRVKTRGAVDTITLQQGLNEGMHHLMVVKNTEANIGWIKVKGLICNKLLELSPAATRKMEFIGNSITCAAGADASEVPCGTGQWQDQHNAYKSYGVLTAQNLNAQWYLNSVSGIGLIRSCCDMEILMPQVYDKIDMRGDSLAWDFKQYQSDVVNVCLGQNDGIQDSVAFCSAYVQFLDRLRGYYPSAQLICLTSPMADEKLASVQRRYLTGVVNAMNQKGEHKVDKYFFSKQYASGCDYHPNLEEHALIAEELTTFIRKKMNW